MTRWHHSLAIALTLSLAAIAFMLSSAAPVVAQQSKIVLAQIVNSTREPVPVVDVGSPAETTVILDAQFSGFASEGVDVSAFEQVRVVVAPDGFSHCTVRSFVQYGTSTTGIVPLGEVTTEPFIGATATYMVPGRTLRIQTSTSTCNNRVVVFGRP
jgi:hypothetical protein